MCALAMRRSAELATRMPVTPYVSMTAPPRTAPPSIEPWIAATRMPPPLSAWSGMVRVSQVDQPTGVIPTAKPNPAMAAIAAIWDVPTTSRLATRRP